MNPSIECIQGIGRSLVVSLPDRMPAKYRITSGVMMMSTSLIYDVHFLLHLVFCGFLDKEGQLAQKFNDRPFLSGIPDDGSDRIPRTFFALAWICLWNKTLLTFTLLISLEVINLLSFRWYILTMILLPCRDQEPTDWKPLYDGLQWLYCPDRLAGRQV